MLCHRDNYGLRQAINGSCQCPLLDLQQTLPTTYISKQNIECGTSEDARFNLEWVVDLV